MPARMDRLLEQIDQTLIECDATRLPPVVKLTREQFDLLAQANPSLGQPVTPSLPGVPVQLVERPDRQRVQLGGRDWNPGGPTPGPGADTVLDFLRRLPGVELTPWQESVVRAVYAEPDVGRRLADPGPRRFDLRRPWRRWWSR